MKTYPPTVFLLAVTALSFVFLYGCDQSDDLPEIFLNKQWKLTDIYHDQNPPHQVKDYWLTEEERDASFKKLFENKGYFVIRFEGLGEENKITGDFIGKATTVDITGSWTADGKSKAFSANLQATSDGDKLGTAFIKGLNAAYKYGGDANNLQIFFKDGSLTKYLLFHVNKE